MTLNQDKVLEICCDKRYSGSTMRVLYYFHAIADYGNRIPYLSQTKIAEKLRMTQSEVSNAIRTLEDDKIILKKEPYKDFYFAEDLLFKGSAYYDKNDTINGV